MFQSIWDLIVLDISGLLIQLFFVYTIILMVFDTQKPPLQTCILTGLALMLLALGGSFLSPLTAGLSFLNGIIWLILGYQRYHQTHDN